LASARCATTALKACPGSALTATPVADSAASVTVAVNATGGSVKAFPLQLSDRLTEPL
jgi:hypothetical protein